MLQVNCQYWKKLNNFDIGLCSLGKFNSRPHLKNCQECELCKSITSVKEKIKFYDKHPMHGTKIFWVTNGNSIDLINLYHGNNIFLICNGPSFKNINPNLLHQPGILTMTVNNGGHIFRSQLWTGQDPPDKFMKSIWDDPKIIKFTLYQYRKHIYCESKKLVGECPNVIFHKRHSNFIAEKWLQEKEIVWGRPLKDGGNRSVLLAALHILYFLGFQNIYLLGADFEMSANKKYFFDENRSKNAIKNNNRLFINVSNYLKQLKPYIENIGMRIYNCNPLSKLEVFDFKNLDDCLIENVIDISTSTVGMYERKK